jgi:hypothetical protein
MTAVPYKVVWNAKKRRPLSRPVDHGPDDIL